MMSLPERVYDKSLKEEFIHKLDKETKVDIEHVDEIPRERISKFRMINNKADLF